MHMICDCLICDAWISGDACLRDSAHAYMGGEPWLRPACMRSASIRGPLGGPGSVGSPAAGLGPCGRVAPGRTTGASQHPLSWKQLSSHAPEYSPLLKCGASTVHVVGCILASAHAFTAGVGSILPRSPPALHACAWHLPELAGVMPLPFLMKQEGKPAEQRHKIPVSLAALLVHARARGAHWAVRASSPTVSPRPAGFSRF